MSVEDGLSSKQKFDRKESNPPTDSKTDRPTSNGNIGSKRGGKTKK